MATVREKVRQDFLEDPEIKDIVEDILHPYLKKNEAVVAIQFGVPKGKEDEWREAIGFASGYNTYTSKKSGGLTRHRVEFRASQSWEIHQIYEMVEHSPHLEIFIDNMRLPYAATLWLPLLWFYLP